jgi:hypothetical protein
MNRSKKSISREGFAEPFLPMFLVWICIDLALLDPDPYWKGGPGSENKKNLPKLTNKPDYQPFKMAFLPTYYR